MRQRLCHLPFLSILTKSIKLMTEMLGMSYWYATGRRRGNSCQGLFVPSVDVWRMDMFLADGIFFFCIPFAFLAQHVHAGLHLSEEIVAQGCFDFSHLLFGLHIREHLQQLQLHGIERGPISLYCLFHFYHYHISSDAKLRISERKRKFIWSFPNESNFGEARVTKSRVQYKRNACISVISVLSWTSQATSRLLCETRKKLASLGDEGDACVEKRS